MGIYENIRELADKKGMSITTLEETAKVPNGIIGKWKKTTPRVDSLQKVANTLGVTVNRLLRDVEFNKEKENA